MLTATCIGDYKYDSPQKILHGYLFSGVIACLPGSHVCLGITSCLPIIEKDWYIRTFSRSLQAGIENANQLLKNLSMVPRKCLGSFMWVSTVLQYS